MEPIKLKYNDGEVTVYCTGCKRIINEGEKFAIVIDSYDDSEKPYHLDCCPAEEEE